MKSGIYAIILLAILASSCGEYSKLLKSTDYELKKTKAKEYYADQQYAKSSELLGQIIPRYRATEEAEELNWLYAQSYYGMKQYELASNYFKSLVEQYPFGKYAEDATFLGSLCDYYLSPRAELDQDNTRNAIEGFNLFVNRYPASPKVQEARDHITELQDKLVEKSYLNAKLYYNMREFKAAITALTNSLKEYSESKYREEMMFLKLNSLYLYAVNSYQEKQTERYQAALDDYFSFMEEYPESKYSREVRKIYDDTAKFLKLDNTNNIVNVQ